MPLIAIPNVSTSDAAHVARLGEVVESGGARVLDVHRDDEHGRSVLTCTGENDPLIGAMTALAIETSALVRLQSHAGAHPRVGTLDVCPFVPHELEMSEAVAAARGTGRLIGAAGIPVFFYGRASDPSRSLPEIRAGGLPGLLGRLSSGWVPDEGPSTIDPDTGVVCVGARDVLIAFNVWIDGDLDIARRIATHIRAGLGGLPGVRALGLEVTAHGTSQISMNLVSPEETGIDRAFERIADLTGRQGCRPVATEIVGLVPERFLPDPDATAARLLIEPGRSLEAALLN
jgi:glutamate formiminotransferase